MLVKETILDLIDWLLDKMVGPLVVPNKSIKSDNDVCYMTLEQSRELKEKMENDIKIAKNAIKKAEKLKNGEIGDFLFPIPESLINDKVDEEEEFDKVIGFEEEFGQMTDFLKEWKNEL